MGATYLLLDKATEKCQTTLLEIYSECVNMKSFSVSELSVAISSIFLIYQELSYATGCMQHVTSEDQVLEVTLLTLDLFLGLHVDTTLTNTSPEGGRWSASHPISSEVYIIVIPEACF